MDVNKELIRKFLNKECDPVEAEKVAAFLQEHPELLNEIYNEAEWQAEEGQDLPEETWNRVWQTIRKEDKKKLPVSMFWYAAACLLAVVSVLYFIQTGRNEKDHPIVKTVPVKKDQHQGIVLGNRSDTTLRTTLPDGTIVYLSRQSEIQYDQVAWTGQREILLKGEAVFYVAKDTAKPFIVFCDRLSVKALGTVFWVNGNTNGDGLKVRLFEGKVVVKPHGSDPLKTFESFLLPGQELVLEAEKSLPYVHYFMQGKRQHIFVKQKTNKGGKAPLTPSGWFEFRSQAVDDVFKTLEVLYDVRISYDRSEVKNMFFIGRFEPTDSIGDILNTIALLNNLRIEQKMNNHYVVHKSK
jgi:transmembrane sensor